MRAIMTALYIFLAVGAAPVMAEIELPATMPPKAAPGTFDRNLAIAIADWERFSGFNRSSQPDRLVIRDFVPVPLVDGSIVIPGLGVRLLPTKEAKRDVLKIIDMREYGAIWRLRAEPPAGFGGIGGLIGGTAFSLDQNLRTALSSRGELKLQQGFSIPILNAVPYLDHKNEPSVQMRQGRLRVEPLSKPLGRWLVAEPAPQAAPSPQEEFEALMADFRTKLSDSPCELENSEMMDLERHLDLLDNAANGELPNVNIWNDRDVACAIATHGPFDIADLERLVALREGNCENLAGGLSEELRQKAREIQWQVEPPDGFLSWARFGLFDLRDPSRVGLNAQEGAARRACVVRYLEDELFATR